MLDRHVLLSSHNWDYVHWQHACTSHAYECIVMSRGCKYVANKDRHVSGLCPVNMCFTLVISEQHEINGPIHLQN